MFDVREGFLISSSGSNKLQTGTYFQFRPGKTWYSKSKVWFLNMISCGVFFWWNLPSNIICIVLKGSPGLDYVLLLLNSYYFLSFILEGGCFCSRWLLKFLVNCLHPFFCIKPQVPPNLWNPKVFHILLVWSILQSRHISACSLARDGTLRVLPSKSFLLSFQNIWEQLVSQWKLMRHHKASSEKKVLPLLLLALTFPHP